MLLDFWKNWTKKQESKVGSITNSKNWIAKCVELEYFNKIAMERYLCVMKILETSKEPAQYRFCKTSKGIPVLIKSIGQGQEIQVFNVNANPEAFCMLRLQSKITETHSEICQIVGGARLGHGKLAVEHWVYLCQMNKIQKGVVKLKPYDGEIKFKLESFFKACGFHHISQNIDGTRMEIIF